MKRCHRVLLRSLGKDAMPVALYCKSYSADLSRLENLLESIEIHNADQLPVYVSVPQRDMESAGLLLNQKKVILISDESITGKKLDDSQITQQIVKLSVWKSIKEDVILMLDSDSYFIKDFHERSFVDSVGAAYTVMHQQKDYFQFTSRLCAVNNLDTGVAKRGFLKDRLSIKKAMGAVVDEHTVVHDFGPSPYVWNSKVLESFYIDFLAEKKMTLEDCMEISASELSWYGEWLLHERPIDLIPVEPLFKVFHVPQQYQLALALKETEDSLKENYYGIVLQSNWNAPYRFGDPMGRGRERA